MVRAASPGARWERGLLILISSWGRSLGRLILRIFRPFRRMAFRLGVAYTLTSLGAVILIELLVAGGLAAVLFGQGAILDAYTETAQSCAFQVGRVLARPPVTELALTQHLDRALARSRPAYPLSFLSQSDAYGPVAAVTDTHGRVLACAPGVPFAVGRPLTEQLTPDAAAQVRTAAGTPSFRFATAHRSPDGSLLAVAPIRNDAGRRIGFLFVRSTESVTPGLFCQLVLILIACTVPVVLLLGGLTGLVFGAVAARPLSRRIRALTAITDAWGRGDFSETPLTRGGDEISDLARHLAAMTEHLRRHIRAQQRLATLEERNRLARDLHDTVKQQAFAAAMQLGAARTVLSGDTGPAGVFVAQAEKLTNKVQEDLAALIHELRPAGEREDQDREAGRGLPSLLREEVLDWSQGSGIPADVRSEGEPDVPPDVSLAFLRITQEALANVARHSRAGRVRVDLTPSADGALALTIADDGRGFDPVFAPRGMGLSSMRDRALSLPGGRFALETAPGAGVTVRASCAGGGPGDG